MTACAVADYFLTRVEEEAGDSLSNLKLQKLVYYAQGFHLALYDKPLISEMIQAWEHGPVIPELYHSYKIYGSQPIPRPDGIDFDEYSPEETELLDEVFEVYGQFSAWKLRSMTHSEPPWREAYDRCPSSEISHESMKAFFRTRLADGQD